VYKISDFLAELERSAYTKPGELSLRPTFSEPPKWERWAIRDINPLSGQKKVRMLTVPNEALRFLHKGLIYLLRVSKKASSALHYARGARPGFSHQRLVSEHRGNRFFYVVDLKDAYSQVDHSLMIKIVIEFLRAIPHFEAFSEEDEAGVTIFLERYFLLPEIPGLPVGLPASPDLFNAYIGTLVNWRISKMISAGHYTHYLDDLVFSFRSRPSRKKRREIRETLKQWRLPINHGKCQFKDLKKGPIVITGIGLEYGGRMFIPRNYTRKIAGLVHRALETRDPHEIARARGMVGLVLHTLKVARQVPNQHEEKLLRSFRKLQDDPENNR